METLPVLMTKPVPTMAWALKPLETKRLPAKELEATVFWIKRELIVSEPEAPTEMTFLPLVSVTVKTFPVKEEEGAVWILKILPVVRLVAEMEATEPATLEDLIAKEPEEAEPARVSMIVKAPLGEVVPRAKRLWVTSQVSWVEPEATVDDWKKVI